MPTNVACSNCGKRVTIPDNLAGRALRCPACKSLLGAGTAPTGQFGQPAGGGPRGERRGAWIKFGGTIALVGIVAFAAPFFGLSLRKTRDLSAAGQHAAGVLLVVVGAVIAGLGLMPAMSRRAKNILWIGAGSAVGLFLLMIVLLLAFADRPMPSTTPPPPPTFAAAPRNLPPPPQGAASGKPAWPATPAAAAPVPVPAPTPTPADAGQRIAPPAAAPRNIPPPPQGAASGKPTWPTTPAAPAPVPVDPVLAIATAPPAWANNGRASRINLRGAKPGDEAAIRAAVDKSKWTGVVMVGPTAAGECTLYADFSSWHVVYYSQRLGRLTDSANNVFNINWGEPVSRPPPSTRPRVAEAPAAPPTPAPEPAWTREADVTLILLHGSTIKDLGVVQDRLGASGFRQTVGYNPDAAGVRRIFVRGLPDAVAAAQRLGPILRRDGKTIEVRWSPDEKTPAGGGARR